MVVAALALAVISSFASVKSATEVFITPPVIPVCVMLAAAVIASDSVPDATVGVAPTISHPSAFVAKSPLVNTFVSPNAK